MALRKPFSITTLALLSILFVMASAAENTFNECLECFAKFQYYDTKLSMCTSSRTDPYNQKIYFWDQCIVRINDAFDKTKIIYENIKE